MWGVPTWFRNILIPAEVPENIFSCGHVFHVECRAAARSEAAAPDAVIQGNILHSFTVQPQIMEILKISAFSDGLEGGNPAGVVLAAQMPEEAQMRALAAELAYSETAFACPIATMANSFRVRYFSPETEVDFCGHATIALGAALAMRHGDGEFALQINPGAISVSGRREGELFAASLQSPPTRSQAADPDLVADVLALFGYAENLPDPALAPAIIHAGVNHLLLPLRSRAALAMMEYDLDAGRELMREYDLTTIMLSWAEHPQLFHVRNAFASGGVLEDPATGAACAAFAGYLRDAGWPHGGVIDLIQGEDMGMRSRLRAEIGPLAGSSIRVSGTARLL